ncbi:MAG: hypothetical protein HY804_00650 [Nitrospinae bacterium]|nr:hypothetical protein [Nitrospinota bacterium]
MNQGLFAAGLAIFGFTLMVLLPASMRRHWDEMGGRPAAGGSLLLLMRFMGLVVILIGAMIALGYLNLAGAPGGDG